MKHSQEIVLKMCKQLLIAWTDIRKCCTKLTKEEIKELDNSIEKLKKQIEEMEQDEQPN